MHGSNAFSRWQQATVLTSLTLILGGCLSDEKSAESTTDTTTDNRITGSVGDGPIANASMQILKNDGAVLAEFESDASADYDVTIRTKGSNYPLTIEARGGTDLVTNLPPDMTMFGVVAKAGKNTVANVNPFSTMAAEIARNMPDGLTAKNYEAAEAITVALFNSGLSTLDELGPATTNIDASNIAEIIKSSETLAEILRRTRDYRQFVGDSSSVNLVVRELASDAIDSVVDGLGGSLTSPRTAALSTVIAAQVLLESMSNELHVNGIDATAAMTASMERILGSTPATGIGDQTATPEALVSVRTGLAAAFEVTSDPKVAELQTIVDGMQAGMDYVLVRSLLPDDYRQTLDSAIITVATGDTAVVNTVNSISRSGVDEPFVDEPLVNGAPVISGSPAASVAVGSTYSFTPTASDPDGDALTYSIANKPDWASFNTSTGRLSGTPAAADVGVYNNISITVSDGSASSTLGSFSITVNAISLGSVTLSWTPPTENEDGSPLTDLSGYRIYWGTTPGVYPNSVALNNPGMTTYVVDNLAPGTYEFVATSVNSSGMESAYSNPAIRTVP